MTMTDANLLLSPLTVGRHTLRNRVLVTGHTTCYVDADNLPDERDVAYFAARARGGAALLCTGTNVVHKSSPLPYGVYRAYDDRIVPRHAAIADAVHAHGALMLVQLGHLGQRNYDAPIPTWSPSPIAHHTGGPIPHEMTVAEIEDVVAGFGDSAARAVRAGMDGVEVGVGHGQLVNLFLSPLTNARDDAYGGSPERRMRFALEVLRAVREAVGDALVGARVNGEDGVPGGLDAGAWLAISETIAATGLASYLSVSLDFHESRVPGMHQPRGVYLGHAERLRRRVGVPVFAVGRIVDPADAEGALARGQVDAVGMVRAHIADPDFVAKLAGGRGAEIRPCIGCGHLCIGQVQRAQPISCVYNPVTGAELTRGPRLATRAAVARRVVVVGGGPGGLEAARVATLLGHSVVLLERDGALGGAVRLAAAVGGRGELGRLITWYAAELERLGVDVRTGVEATPEVIAGLDPELVVLACGARPASPPWAAGHARVTTVRELIADRPPIAGHVVVVDQDHHGQALQAAIVALDAGCTVTVVSARIAVAVGLERPSLDDLYRAVLLRDGELLPRRHVLGLSAAPAGRLAVALREDATGRESELLGDWVVTTAAAPDERLARALPARPGVAVSVIGDGVAPRMIASAVHEAFDALTAAPAEAAA
jgi:2,4-dienoyl-CoA reductase (NADPH2)